MEIVEMEWFVCNFAVLSKTQPNNECKSKNDTYPYR